jgi:FkbM family methyltransferase
MNLLQRIIRSDSPKLERPFHAMVGYALQRTGFSSKLQLRRSRYTVPFFPKSNMALTYWVKPDVIDRAEEFACEYLKPGATMVDVGANIGCVSAASSLAVGDSGRVCAIEAHPQTFRNLQETIRVNGFTNVTALNVALGSRSGTVCFTDEKRKDDNNRVSLTGATGIEVPCVTLSALLKEQSISHVHLMKLDVEGFEMEVLRGAVDVLSAVDCLYVEILDHTLRRFGSSAEELKSFLRSHGFQCFQFHGDSSNAVCFSPRVSPERWKSQLVPLV